MALPSAAQEVPEGPAELPPADYAGRDFVDSTGCVYGRAVVDGAVTWVPRIAADRRQLCGLVPTFAGGVLEPLPPRAEPGEPVRVSGAGLAADPAGLRLPPPAAAAPAAAEVATPAPPAPVAAEAAAEPEAVTEAAEPPPAPQPQATPAPVVAQPAPPPPQAAPPAAEPPRTVQRSTQRTRQAAAPVPPANVHYRWVQVGVFRVPDNARRSAERLQAAGLPHYVHPVQTRDGVLEIVVAGPFSTRAEMLDGLARARAAGFHDAYPRN